MSWGASAPPSRGESRKFPEVLSWPFSLFGFAHGPPPGGASALLLQGAASSKLPRRTGAAIVFTIHLPVNVKGYSSPAGVVLWWIVVETSPGAMRGASQ